jgi:hypothetical protein
MWRIRNEVVDFAGGKRSALESYLPKLPYSASLSSMSEERRTCVEADQKAGERAMSYDEKCYALAEEFLSDTDTFYLGSAANRDKLAQEIQDTIEDFIRKAKDNYEPPDDPVAWSGGFAPNH